MTFKNRNSFAITKSVLFALLLREMRSRFSAKRFGIFWILFEPIFQIVLFVVIFTLRGRTVANVDFSAYLVTGMIPFFLMRNMILKGMEAVSANKALFSYKQIKAFDTVLARCLMEIVLYACIYFIFMVVMAFWFDIDIFIVDPLRWAAVLIVGLVFAFSLALLFCMLAEALPESKSIIRLLFFPLYLLSGVLFPIWLLPNEIISLLLWNPFVHIIDELRASTFQHYALHAGINLLYPLKLSIFLLFVSLGLYRLRRFRLVAL